jgi:hypothetical protein
MVNKERCGLCHPATPSVWRLPACLPAQELLYSHGFCVRDNPMDDVALVLDSAAGGGDAPCQDQGLRARSGRRGPSGSNG